MTEKVRRDFVKYSFFKVDPAWRRLPAKERQDSKAQFAEVLSEFSDRVSMSSYSLVGTRGDGSKGAWRSVSPPVAFTVSNATKRSGSPLALPELSTLKVAPRPAGPPGIPVLYWVVMISPRWTSSKSISTAWVAEVPNRTAPAIASRHARARARQV